MAIGGKAVLRPAVIVLVAVAIAASLGFVIWSQLSGELSVRTDVVGYPTFASFNPELYYQRYWLLVGLCPFVALVLFLILDRVVPGRRTASPQTDRTEPAPRVVANSGWPTAGRIGLVGAILALEIATQVRGERDWIWTMGLPVMTLYGGATAALGRWVNALPGKNAWERAAAANALCVPLVVLGLAAAAAETKVVGPDREWSFPWLPGWLALSASLAALAWIAAQLHRGVTPLAVDRRAALVISAPVAIFLVISALPGGLGGMDMFHEGERLAAAELLREGAFPWRDLIFIHGLLDDVLAPLVGMTIFEDSRWGAAAGASVLLVPLYWISVYAFCAYLFQGNWLFLVASQLAVFGSVAATSPSALASVSGIVPPQFAFIFATELRFLLLPLMLIGMIALLRRATAVRAASFAGITLIQTIVSPEAAIAGVIFFVTIVAYEGIGFQRRLPIRENFLRTWLTAAFGSAQLALWCAFLAWHHAVDDFFSVYFTFASSHALVGGIPVQPGGIYYSLAMYLPPAAALVMLGLVTAFIIRRQRVSAEDAGAFGMALFVLAYYHKFLSRPDAPHVVQVAAVSVPLVLYVVFRIVNAIDPLFARIRSARAHIGYAPLATIGALAFVVVVNAHSLGRTLESLPSRLEAPADAAPDLRPVGFTTEGAVDKAAVRDLREIVRFYLRSGDTVFDFSNTPALFHYILDLQPATRYYHVSLAARRRTQLDLIRALEQNRPRLVFFSGPIPGWDGVSNPIRHYEISEWVLRRYRPVASSHGFVVMVPKALLSRSFAALRRRLVEPPQTDHLYSRGPPCNWGYAPNFLTTKPSTGGTTLTIEPASEPAMVRGWAVDLSARKPAKLVLVAVGKRIVAWAKPSIPRPDVQRFVGGNAFRRSGYEIRVPWNRIAAAPGDSKVPSVRIYGLLHDGRAVELGDGAFGDWQPIGQGPPELSLRGWRIPVADEAAQGVVDESATGFVAVRAPTFASYSWLEIESPRPLAANDFRVTTEGDPSDALTFSTLGRGERRIRIRAAACSQWFGYRGGRLLIRSRIYPNITAVRLYR